MAIYFARSSAKGKHLQQTQDQLTTHSHTKFEEQVS